MLFSSALPVFLVSHLALAAAWVTQEPALPHCRPDHPLRRCVVRANRDGSDDAPAIRRAFDKCRTNGNVIFENTTYHVNSVLNTTNLFNCQVDIYGTLLMRFGEVSSYMTLQPNIRPGSGAMTRRIGSTTQCPLDIRTCQQCGSVVVDRLMFRDTAMEHSTAMVRHGMI
jgi:hypothetical protein